MQFDLKKMLESIRVSIGSDPDGEQCSWSIVVGCGYLIAAGYGRTAYDILSALMGSSLYSPIWQEHPHPASSTIDCQLMPGLCWAFGAPFPASHNRPMLYGQELKAHIKEMESRGLWDGLCGCSSLSDKGFLSKWPWQAIERIATTENWPKQDIELLKKSFRFSKGRQATFIDQISQFLLPEPNYDRKYQDSVNALDMAEKLGWLSQTHTKYVQFLACEERYSEAVEHIQFHEARLPVDRLAWFSQTPFWLAGWLSCRELGKSDLSEHYLKRWWLALIEGSCVVLTWPLLIKELSEGALKDYIGLPEEAVLNFQGEALKRIYESGSFIQSHEPT